VASAGTKAPSGNLIAPRGVTQGYIHIDEVLRLATEFRVKLRAFRVRGLAGALATAANLGALCLLEYFGLCLSRSLPRPTAAARDRRFDPRVSGQALGGRLERVQEFTSRVNKCFVLRVTSTRLWARAVELGAKASTSDPGVGTVLPAKRHTPVAPTRAGQARH
jgi:hypothetical protein